MQADVGRLIAVVQAGPGGSLDSGASLEIRIEG